MAVDPNVFPLLKAPHVVLREIAKASHLTGILKISMLSNKCAIAMNDARVRLTRMTVDIYENSVRIIMEREGQDELTSWTIPRRRRSFMSPARIVGDDYTFDCEHFEVSERSLQTIFKEDERVKGVDSAVRHVCYVFIRTRFTLNIRSEGSEVWRRFWEESCTEIHIYYAMSGEDLDELLGRFADALQSFSIYDDSSPLAERFDRVRNVFSVFIACGSWFTVEHLRRVNCSRITVQDTQLTNGEMRRWIEEWKVDGCGRTGTSVSLARREGSIDRRLIAEGDWIPLWNDIPLGTERQYFMGKFQIRRHSDGARLDVIVLDKTIQFIM